MLGYIHKPTDSSLLYEDEYEGKTPPDPGEHESREEDTASLDHSAFLANHVYGFPAVVSGCVCVCVCACF